MRIVVDAMGGDYAPYEVVAGAVEYVRRHGDVQVTLVGDATEVERCIRGMGATGVPLQVVHAPSVVTMGEEPAVAVRRKRDSSIAVCCGMVARGEADAVVSAGNTGAAVAAALLEWKMLPGIDRPAIAATVPGPLGATVLIDAGATVNCKAVHLVQFAQMGACYARVMLERAHPVVGLLSVGEEDAKGNAVTREAFRLLRESRLPFYGNVEGQDLFSGKVDVIVCDGFVGNVALKVMEGMAHGMRMLFERHASWRGWLRGLQRWLIRPVLWRVSRRFDAARLGGAPLLGVQGVCIC
ncbi:MAG: phosphate acyltransferase PlsX, partial [bacterium]|nr:phosphate acyltransferase PlsX [bacterium]